MRKVQLAAVIAAFAISAPAMAQGRGRGNDGVPPGQRPAAGMCRIWIDGVPPGHQPAPTDCATAAARVPPNGRIIYGDQTSSVSRDPRRDVYDQNGRVYDPRRVDPSGQVIYDPRRTDSNGQVIYDPRRADQNGQVITRNGERCVQRVDANGRVYTRCDSPTEQRYYSRQGRDDDRASESKHKAKKHKNDGNDDRN